MTTTSAVGPLPPLDPELAAGLAGMPAIGLGDSVTVDMIPARRELIAQLAQVADADLRCDGGYDVSTRLVPGPQGAPDVELLICLPSAATTPVATLYHIHGGGMILGNNRAGVMGMLDLAAPFGMAVVSVEYRLAPEHPYPAGMEDCYAGLSWVASHAGELGIDPARLVVAGASAGGGLSAAVALAARDRGGPRLAGQLLLCPMLDDRNDTPSAVQMAGGAIWSRAANELGWTALLGPLRGGPDVPPYAAPARATDLSGLPPAFIDVGSAEAFRDEAVEYASRIWRGGGVAELHVWPGGFHAFAGFVPDAAISKDSLAAPARWLGRLLAQLG